MTRHVFTALLLALTSIPALGENARDGLPNAPSGAPATTVAHFISQGNDQIGLGKTSTYTLTANDIIIGSRTISGMPQVLAMRPLGAGSGSWSMTFSGADLTLLTPGTYFSPAVSTNPPPGRPGMYVSQDTRVCDPIAASSFFTVHEIGFAFPGPGSDVTSLALDFVQSCAGSNDKLYGYIRINSSIPYTPVTDTSPSAFSFPGVVNAVPGTDVVSATVIISDFNTGVPISIVNGDYSVDGAPFTRQPGSILPGQSLRVRLTASASFSTTVMSTVTVGDQNATFYVTTGMSDFQPDAVVFAPVTGAPLNSWAYSNIVTVTGFNTRVGVARQDFSTEFSVNGAPFAATGVSILPGQTLQVRTITSSLRGTTIVSNFSVGGTLASFSTTTIAGADVQLTISGSGSVSFTPGNTTCSQSCALTFDQGTAITLTASPAATWSFVGWNGGGCSGTGACNTTLNASVQITANFSAAPPDPPVLDRAIAGDARATLAFTPLQMSGGAPITGFSAVCQPGAIAAAGTRSPLVVTGLTNGTAYSCSIQALNANGSSSPSNALPVTPDTLLPLSLVSVSSRKMHGALGPFDIKIDPATDLAGPVDMEPRAIGTGHQIVFLFNDQVATIGSVIAQNMVAQTVGNASHAFMGQELIVTLTGVQDNQRTKIFLNSVNGTTAVSAALGFLVGDVNNTRRITASDLAAIKSRKGQLVDLVNFRFDIDTSGSIDNSDVAAAKARSGQATP